MLWSKCKKLYDLGKINNFFISNDTIQVKINQNGRPILVPHNIDDFDTVNIFPELIYYQRHSDSFGWYYFCC